MTPGTIEAYETALAKGVAMVEVDVRQAADGEFLALHDSSVGGFPLSSLSTFDVSERLGRPIPTVEAVARVVDRAGRKLMVDLKEREHELDVIERVLSVLDPSQVVVTTLEDESVRLLRGVFPELEVGLTLGRPQPRPYVRTRLQEVFPFSRVRACGARSLSIHRRFASVGVVGRAARVGLPVYLWTVDDDAELRRFLADARLRGVITNRPLRALELLGR